MPDLKTPWTNPPTDLYPDLGGDSITGRGTDPNVDLGGASGLTAVAWTNDPVPPLDGQESPNSVSGLPSTPNRFEPTDQPPPPPTLQDRRPGTIDER